MRRTGGYATTGDLLRAGITRDQMRIMLGRNWIIPIKRGLFRSAHYPFAGHEEIRRVQTGSARCYLSAVSTVLPRMSERQPEEYQVAVHRDGTKPVLPDHPPISLFYFSTNQFETGPMAIDVLGNTVMIYDAEKTLCDCARYEKKLGSDLVREGFLAYLRRPNRDIDKLLLYAKKTRALSLVMKYVEVLA